FLYQYARPNEAAVIDAWSADAERKDRARTALRQLTNAISESVSIKEAAAILNVDRSRISRRIYPERSVGLRSPRQQTHPTQAVPGRRTTSRTGCDRPRHPT